MRRWTTRGLLVLAAAVVVLAVAVTSLLSGDARTPVPPAGPPLDAGRARVLLARHRPLYVMDARDRDRPTRVESLVSRAVLRDTDGRVLDRHPTGSSLRPGGAGQVLDGPDDGASPGASTVYGDVRRQDGRTWLQYWTFLPDNPQDRGLTRTGRHEGDWEFSQIGLDARDRPAVVTLAQHRWAEGCSYDRVRTRGPRPVLFLANGSHATYLTAGEHGRPWPDPDDEARGDGERVDPVLLRLDRQPWVGWAGRWGGSRASPPLPVEASSPVGPAFQDSDQLRTPTTFHRDARPCGSGAPTTVRNGAAGGVVLLLGAVVALVRRRRATRRAARSRA